VNRSHTPAATGCALLALAAVLVSACAVGPDFKRPAAPAVDRYTAEPLAGDTVAADGHSQRFADNAAVPGDWWQLFGAADLDRVVHEALERNQTLAAATANLRQSENARRAGFGVFLPQVSAGGTAVRERVSPLELGQAGGSNLFNLFTVSGSVGYVLDLFGGNRRRLEALGAEVDLARDNELAAYLALTANVVNTTIARAAYRAEANATRDSIAAAREQVRLAEAQAEAGTAAYASVLALRTQLAALEASLPPLELHADQAGHLLAVLAGRSPAEWSPPEIALDALQLPADLPVSLPSALVRQRPDILAAEASLHVASAEIGVATANMLPSITLSGALGSEATRLGNLGAEAGHVWSAGGDISVPVFQGGSLWYTRQAAVDAYKASFADYRQTVLTAFEQVADTLRALEHDAESVRASAAAAQAAEESLALTQANYQSGIADYLAVLTATQQVQSARLGYLQASAQRLQDTVALYVALGGGWWTAATPIPGIPPSAARAAH
jgi:NodT family efflux transporter outer membrane factor (OMF) lipoprotein